jgi:hypothetical protein
VLPWLFNNVIHNLILSILTRHPTQHHHHLLYAYFILVLVLNRLTLHIIQHHQFDSCSIEFSFQLNQYFLSHKTLATLLHFNHPAYPAWIQWFTYVSLSPSFCTMNSKYLNLCNLKYDMIFNFYLQDRTISPFVEVKLHIVSKEKKKKVTLHMYVSRATITTIAGWNHRLMWTVKRTNETK